MREYDLIADWYATDRGGGAVVEALAVAAMLPPHSRILDVGSGNGVPITDALVLPAIARLVSTTPLQWLPASEPISRARLSCVATPAGVRSRTAASTRPSAGG